MENELFEKLDQLLLTKRYEELTREERFWMDEQLDGELTYSRLHLILCSSASETTLLVDASIKKSLIKKMKLKNRSQWARVVNYNVPAYAVAILLLLVATLVLLVTPKQDKVVEKIVTVTPRQPPATTVTKFVTDTIFVDHIIKVPVYVPSQTKDKTSVDKSIALPGKSLADQIELRNLLVQSE
jgi:hypothetical protein